jgi:predicted ABC-type ATPase
MTAGSKGEAPQKGEAAPARGPAQRRQGDVLKDKSAKESEFQTRFSPGSVRQAPIKLGAKEYDQALWDSPLLRTLKRALVGWEVPAPAGGQALSRALKDDDPRLRPTIERPSREGWRRAMQAALVHAGVVHAKPKAYFLAGPMGVGKLVVSQRLYAQGALPGAVVKADADYLHELVPELHELTALGEGRAAEVVHEEASAIAQAAFAQALAEKRDVVHSTMLGGETQRARLGAAKAAGFKRVVIALVSRLEVAKARAGAGGAAYSEQVLLESHRDFARGFDEVVKGADELVLLHNIGTRIEVIAQGKSGELSVKNERACTEFRALRELKVP